MCEDKWNTQFSGVFYPDFSFLGEKLQNLADLKNNLDFITFFTAPVNNGWAFVFAWHKSSHKTCKVFLSSLAESIHRGYKLEDSLFRFSVSCCENHAFRSSWWVGLESKIKKRILEAAHLLMAPGIQIPNTYLSEGLEGVASWSFGEVISTM